jgi:Mor family transcriptional regulator
MKYQNNCRDKTEVLNCRSWRNVEIPDFAEAEDKISLQKTLLKLNANTKLQKLKRRWNTKTIAETKQKYQIAEAEGMSKYQILQKRKTKYHSKKHCWNWMQIPNYRNWREDEIPKQLQRQNRNTKLQKLKECWNTRFCRSGRQNIIPKNIAETEEKMKYQNNCRDKT